MRLRELRKLVEQVLAGGGGGLVIGPWEDIDATGLLGGNSDPFLIAASPVPYEIEVALIPNVSTNGGIAIVSDDDTQTFLVHVSSYGDPAPNVFERCLIPADTAIKILPAFGGDSVNWIVSGLHRRTLG